MGRLIDWFTTYLRSFFTKDYAVYLAIYTVLFLLLWNVKGIYWWQWLVAAIILAAVSTSITNPK